MVVTMKLYANIAGIATSNPVTVVSSAAATPGAIAVSVAAWLSAMPANVDITPQTVPSSPINGPPATAVDNTIMPFSRAIASVPADSSKITFTASNDAMLILTRVDLARKSVFVCGPSGITLEIALTTTGLFFN